jgi:hypothetical protein
MLVFWTPGLTVVDIAHFGMFDENRDGDEERQRPSTRRGMSFSQMTSRNPPPRRSGG